MTRSLLPTLALAASLAGCVHATAVMPAPINPAEQPALERAILGTCSVASRQTDSGDMRSVSGLSWTFLPNGQASYNALGVVATFMYRVDGRNLMMTGPYKTFRVDEYRGPTLRLFLYDTSETYFCTKLDYRPEPPPAAAPPPPPPPPAPVGEAAPPAPVYAAAPMAADAPPPSPMAPPAAWPTPEAAPAPLPPAAMSVLDRRPWSVGLISGTALDNQGLDYSKGVGLRVGRVVALGGTLRHVYLGGMLASHAGETTSIHWGATSFSGAGTQRYTSSPKIFAADLGYSFDFSLGSIETVFTPMLSFGVAVIPVDTDGIYGMSSITDTFSALGFGVAYDAIFADHFFAGLSYRLYPEGDGSFNFGDSSAGSYPHGYSTSVFFHALYLDVGYHF